jgi:hypothetical protein
MGMGECLRRVQLFVGSLKDNGVTDKVGDSWSMTFCNPPQTEHHHNDTTVMYPVNCHSHISYHGFNANLSIQNHSKYAIALEQLVESRLYSINMANG